jgi:hypothetical protein
VTTRVSVNLDAELKAGIEESPDEFDLDPQLSQAGRYALLLEEGARFRRARRRERIRQEAYVRFAADPVHEEAVNELFALAVDDGLV